MRVLGGGGGGGCRYEAREDYREYVRSTPRLFIGVEVARAHGSRVLTRAMAARARRRARRGEAPPDEGAAAVEEALIEMEAEAAAAAADARVSAFLVDETREALAEKEKQEQRASEIGSMVSVTGLAGLATAAVFALGTLLF